MGSLGKKRWFVSLAILLAAGLVLAACGGDDEAAEGEEHAEEAEHAEGAVHAELSEWSILTEEGGTDFAATAGDVTFEVHNEGDAPHELVVLRTDLPADALPVEGGLVDEAAEGIEEIGEVEEFPGGEIEIGTFHLEAGRYVLICNIAGHYQQGMFAELTVG